MKICMERTVQTLMAGLILVFSLHFASIVDAAYLIKLKNGNEFVTGRYWQEGQQIMFDIYGGAFGLDRAFVSKIEKSGQPIRLTEAAQAMPEQKPQRDIADRNEPLKPSISVDAKPETKRDDDPILKEFYALKEKSKGFDGMLTSELQEFDKELTSFKKRARESTRIDAYMKELAQADEMGDAMEAILKSRRQ
jgi:hypothetical protein